MDRSDIEKTLIELEEKNWQANVNEDLSYFLEHTTDNMLAVAPFGIFDKHAIAAQIEKKQGAPFKSARIEDPRVMVLTNESALVTYKIMIEAIFQGKDIVLQRYSTSVYVKRNGDWKVSFSQQTDISHR